MKKAVMCVARTKEQAEVIVGDLQRGGFVPGDISVLWPDQHGSRDFAHVHSTKAPEGAVTGGVGGGVIGGTLGLLAGLGLLVIPGLGPLLAAGPIVAALSGIAVGGVGGGVIGGFVGMGIPEVEAKLYEGHLRGGNLLIAVHCDGDAERKRARDVFERDGGSHISSVPEVNVPRDARV
jgi:hypothetical protein